MTGEIGSKERSVCAVTGSDLVTLDSQNIIVRDTRLARLNPGLNIILYYEDLRRTLPILAHKFESLLEIPIPVACSYR